tara:strand:- start:753 stop:1286 length:534 start_codon:yes stop_codon:yes gene_type:complete
MMKLLSIFVILVIIYGCSKVRESAGVTRKSIDEFKAIENPPLVIPPDFTLVAPDQLEERNIGNIENELAQEILFGLEDSNDKKNVNLTTMNQILSNAKALEVSDDIRNEIDDEFANEKSSDGIFQLSWENEIEVLDAAKESERIRNQNFNEDPISEGEVPIRKEMKKIKKKKRFIFF